MRKVLRLVSLIVLTVLLMGSVADNVAVADEPLPPGVQMRVIDRTENNVLVASGSAEGMDKRQAIEAVNQVIEGQHALEDATEAVERGVAPEGLGVDYYYDGYGWTYYNGSRVYTYFPNTHLYVEYGWTVEATIDGYTRTFWDGTDPYYSDEIKLTEKWEFQKGSISVSVGTGGVGGTWSTSTNAVQFDSGWVDTAGWSYSLANTYSGVRAQSATLVRVDDTATGVHRFGNNFVTASCHGWKRF